MSFYEPPRTPDAERLAFLDAMIAEADEMQRGRPPGAKSVMELCVREEAARLRGADQ